MIKKSTIQHVFQLFFENPSQKYHLRELSRLLGLSMPTIISTTDLLSKKELIIKKKGKVVTDVMANRENPYFIRYKRSFNLLAVYLSGIVDYLRIEYNHPKAIILFGSFSRGEDVENSDIDIAVFTKKHAELQIGKFEKKLKRKISIHEIQKMSNEFEANLKNGIILEGSW